MNKLTQLFATPSHIEATAAMKQEMNIVPRLAKILFMGSVSQQPSIAQHKYGAPTTSPVRLSCMEVLKRGEVMPSCFRYIA